MSRRGRRAIALAAVACIVGAAWWAVRGAGRAAVAAATIPADVPAARGWALPATAGVDDFAPAALATPSRALAAADPERIDRQRCGIEERPVVAPSAEEQAMRAEQAASAASEAAAEGRAVEAEPPPPAPRPAGPHYAAALAHIDATLRASGDAFSRAVAQLLDLRETQAREARVAGLARIAASTTDPRVYELAYQACAHGSRGTVDCGRLSARRWSQLEPDNGEPWAYLYADAVRAGDVSGQEDALFHLASASRFDTRTFAPAAAVVDAAPPDAEALAASADAVIAAVGQTAAFASELAFVRACPGGGAMDANRAQLCAKIGDTMLDRSDDLMHNTLGGMVWLRATGDPARLEASRAERQRLSSAWQPATSLSECAGYRESLRYLQRAGRIGELAALRERAVDAMRP